MSKSAPDQLVIRQARADDLDVLVRFSAAMALETEGRSLDPERLRLGTQAVFDSPDRGFYLVAEVPGRIVGQLMITYEWSDWRHGVFWWIQSVYVDPSWRRRGVYRRMHQYVIEEARARTEVCGVRLYVEGENHVAKAVYAQVGLVPTTYEVFEDDFLLKRNSDRHAHARSRKPTATGRSLGKGKKTI